ncbi:MAG TPA: hypothetical protein VLI72_15400 [Methylibium sp.]|nr:hypothetical protein [Methylibium sp.]
MKLRPAFARAALLPVLAVLLALSACGGGGGGGGSDGGSPTHPASGAYGWALKAIGPTDALSYGLSLVHPDRPDTEYVIEAPSEVSSDVKLVSGGTLDAAARRVTGLQPHALVYIVGGDVRSVPMQADGSAPGSRVLRADTTSACRFLIDAIDYAALQDSRFVVSTAGADGQCATADDGRAEVRLSASSIGYSAMTGEPPLDALRDPQTLAPRGWLYGRHLSLWSTNPPTLVTVRDATAPALTSVVAATYQSALVDDGARLAVLDFGPGSTVSESLLDAGLTSGGGWQLVGFDADSFYVYRNAGTTFASPWTLLRITRASPAALVLASGTGLVTLSSLGLDVVYLTVFGESDNRLVRVAKAGGAPAEAITPTTTFTSVQTSAAGVHQLWRITDVGSAAPTYAVELVDEANTTLATRAGGFPLNVPEAGTKSFNTSESRTRFTYAVNYGERAFGDARLEVYDAATRTATVLGQLPGSAEFGNDFVFASALGGPTDLGAGFAARSVNGNVQATGARLFSYDLSTANSLRFTSRIVTR